MTKSEDVKNSMNESVDFLRRSQRAWADKRDLLGGTSDGWIDLSKREGNLIWPMSRDTFDAFELGAGNELEGKMRAPHSSSVLAYNMFAAADRPALADALSSVLLTGPPTKGPHRVAFEVKRPTGWGGTPPHLDVELEWDDVVVAVESKFMESFSSKKNARKSLEPYLDSQNAARWPGLTNLRILAQDISDGKRTFEVLDAPQLIKHILGLHRAQLAAGPARRFELVLLWFNAGELSSESKLACSELQREFREFEAAVADDFPVRLVSHQELFAAYEVHVDASVSWMQWLKQRYFSPRA